MKKVIIGTILLSTLIYLSVFNHETYYVVKNDDTLATITKKFRVAPEDIIHRNEIFNAETSPGQELIIEHNGLVVLKPLGSLIFKGMALVQDNTQLLQKIWADKRQGPKATVVTKPDFDIQTDQEQIKTQLHKLVNEERVRNGSLELVMIDEVIEVAETRAKVFADWKEKNQSLMPLATELGGLYFAGENMAAGKNTGEIYGQWMDEKSLNTMINPKVRFTGIGVHKSDWYYVSQVFIRDETFFTVPRSEVTKSTTDQVTIEGYTIYSELPVVVEKIIDRVSPALAKYKGTVKINEHKFQGTIQLNAGKGSYRISIGPAVRYIEYQ